MLIKIMIMIEMKARATKRTILIILRINRIRKKEGCCVGFND